MSFTGEHIWIIGASSGIGEALARELSAQGATLILSARREGELNALNRDLGGRHHVYALDVSDHAAMSAAATDIATRCGRLERIIFMAALYRPADPENRDAEFAKKLVEVNLLGAIYTSYAALPIFEQQQSGQLVLCGSVAGYIGLPGGQPYSATKAAIINFAESLHAEVADYIDIKVINPGFVRTRITDKNRFPMPMRIEPEQAARAIARGLKKRAFEVHFPKGFTYLFKFLSSLPYWLAFKLTHRMKDNA